MIIISQPDVLELSSPFHVHAEQKAVKCVKKKTIEFQTDIFIAPKPKSYAELKKTLSKDTAKVTSRSRSMNMNDNSKVDQEGVCKIYLSPKGIYIQMVQIFHDFKAVPYDEGDPDAESEKPRENTYPNMLKIKLAGDGKKSVEGDLRLVFSEVAIMKKECCNCGVTVNIGLKDVTNIGTASINTKKEVTDPSKSIKFIQNVQFDEKKMSLMISHAAIADVSEKTNSETGTIELKEKIESSIKY
ncbi:hypothetical protein GCK72_004602 [Caenorhabditis remanei]|uniref:Uncharacterized protein n=1 Tax=Caenorhabditis remanei TaxID=31234 RepID=A0A6A5HE38_CAERE|nr:hypothetical protein GCK72_004602 [Caenorhabditis remanei]KAF1764653.1 hypothetical protein GCK72_004602 [Caenorhabditis remanei]